MTIVPPGFEQRGNSGYWYRQGDPNPRMLKACEGCGEPHLIRPDRRFCSLRCAGTRQLAEVSYRTQHKRVAAFRGKASRCVFGHRDAPAYEWAYNEIGDRDDTGAYIEMCAQCHDNYEAGVHGRLTGHGTVSEYRRRDCRCVSCRAAKAVSRKEDR